MVPGFSLGSWSRLRAGTGALSSLTDGTPRFGGAGAILDPAISWKKGPCWTGGVGMGGMAELVELVTEENP